MLHEFRDLELGQGGVLARVPRPLVQTKPISTATSAGAPRKAHDLTGAVVASLCLCALGWADMSSATGSISLARPLDTPLFIVALIASALLVALLLVLRAAVPFHKALQN